MSEVVIRRLLEMRFKAWADRRGEKLVAWQNISYTPPVVVPPETTVPVYFRFFLLPAPVDGEDLAGEHTVFVGVCQIDIVGPRDTGAAPAETIIDELRTLFPKNIRLTDVATGLAVQVLTHLSPAGGFADDLSWVVPTSFVYRLDKI